MQEEDEEDGTGEAAAATAASAAAAEPVLVLTQAGVRRELAEGLCTLSWEADEAPLGLLAWGLLLSMLLHQPPLDRTRKHLSQTLLDLDG